MTRRKGLGKGPRGVIARARRRAREEATGSTVGVDPRPFPLPEDLVELVRELAEAQRYVASPLVQVALFGLRT